MADYDISRAFEAVENELIDSMMRNFSRHRAEEIKEGYNWSQWQAEQLKSFEQYRKRNIKKFSKKFSEINSKIPEMLKTARVDGNASQEAKILMAIKNGFNGPSKPSTNSTAEFFKINDRKLNALIKATTDDLKKAEHAILRMSNDKYRKAIYNAQVYVNSGAGTYEKAVDMAVKDLLNAGLNCVEYKNGARHTLSDYADMALQTANKRAYLYGEGEKRKEWGITTVVVNQRQGGCPDCAKYIGKVFIDDVYSGGKASDGDYPCLSEAIEGGLFHPRCKDSTSTYYEGITTLKPVSREEMAEMERREQLEQKQQYCNRQAKRFDRRAKYSLDEDNKRVCSVRADEWHNKAEIYEHKISDINSKKPTEFITRNNEKSLVKSSESGIINFEKGVTKEVKSTFINVLEEMQAKFGEITSVTSVGILKDNGLAYGSFNDNSGAFLIRFANKKDCLSKLAQKTVEMKKAGKWSSSHPLHIFRHELGHAIQLEHKVNDPLWNEKINKIKTIMRTSGNTSVSEYAMQDINEFISECISESMTRKSRATARQVVNIILGG